MNTKASVQTYLAVDPGFPLNEKANGEVFCATLDGLMRGKGVVYFELADGK